MKDPKALALWEEAPSRLSEAKELAGEPVELSKHELCSWVGCQALGGQSLSSTCREDGTTGQVDVLRALGLLVGSSQGTGGSADASALCASLVPSDNSVETDEELKVKN